MREYLSLFMIFFILSSLQCKKDQSQSEMTPGDSLLQKYPKEYQSLIGLEFGPDSFPSTFEEKTGSVMGFLEGDEYIIDHVSHKSDELIWFCKLTHRDEEGRPFLKILDILILPPLGQDEQIFLGTCRYRTVEDPEIIAIVKLIQNEVSAEVIRAWRANRQMKLFEEVSASDVMCVDESLFL
ncbi:MAG: hypothetical protein JSW33_02720 [bacterium]|nr:MAG: hypothetical protein JSW33_02720 [bacterium]